MKRNHVLGRLRKEKRCISGQSGAVTRNMFSMATIAAYLQLHLYEITFLSLFLYCIPFKTLRNRLFWRGRRERGYWKSYNNIKSLC